MGAIATLPDGSCRVGYNLAQIPLGRSKAVEGDFRIGAWLVQPQLHSVQGDGKTTNLEPKAMQVLVYLAQHPEEVVARQ